MVIGGVVGGVVGGVAGAVIGGAVTHGAGVALSTPPPSPTLFFDNYHYFYAVAD